MAYCLTEIQFLYFELLNDYLIGGFLTMLSKYITLIVEKSARNGGEEYLISYINVRSTYF